MKSAINSRQTKSERQRRRNRRKELQRKRQRRRPGNRQLLRRRFSLPADALQNIAKVPQRPAPISPANVPAQEPDKPDILSVLYSGSYFPKSHMRIKDDPLDKNAHKTLEALRATFSPEQEKLFLQYEAAENVRGASLSERAYRDGVRLAVQLILAGCLEPAELL